MKQILLSTLILFYAHIHAEGLNVVFRIMLNTTPTPSQQKKVVEEIEKVAGVKQATADSNLICIDADKTATIESLKQVITNNGFWIENYVEHSSIDISCSTVK